LPGGLFDAGDALDVALAVAVKDGVRKFGIDS